MARTKGAVNKLKMDAQAKAFELGIDPFEILLLFAAGKWKELGYRDPTKTIAVPGGASYEEDIISAELRVNAAKDATNYLLAKRKSVEHSLNEIPDQVFEQEAERRIHLKILNGELKASDVG